MHRENPVSSYWRTFAEAKAMAGKVNMKREEDEKASREKEDLKAEFIPGGPAGGLYPEPRLAQAYVIWQRYGRVFSPAEALEKGTLFPELYSPYPY